MMTGGIREAIDFANRYSLAWLRVAWQELLKGDYFGRDVACGHAHRWYLVRSRLEQRLIRETGNN